MKSVGKKALSLLLSLMMVVGVIAVGGGNIKVGAATFADLNQSSVWIKQSQSGPCVLDACAMMIRRTLIGTGNTNWSSVTESSLKGTACQSGSWSVWYSFDYRGVSVRHTSFDSTAGSLKSILDSHPEGIVLFSRSKGHAVLVTDYSGDTFYCADPAYGDKRNLNSSNQGVSYSNSTEYWYVSSPSITLTTDTIAPTIIEYGIIQTDSDGYTAYCSFSDNVGVTRVRFPTWTPWQGSNNGQDDLIWYEGSFEADGKTAWARVKRSEHNNELGTYVTHIYVYDGAGNCSQVETSIVVENDAPEISSVAISNITTTGYTVSCTVTDQNSIDRVQFPSWHTWDDLKWLNGTVNGTTVTCRVNVSDFNNLTGTYQTHIYAYDIWGNVCSVDAGKVYVPSSDELYTVTYDANGGKGAPSSNSAYVEVKLSNTKPTRDGYEFLGWAKSSTATTAQYQPGETIKPGKSITLYAVWKQIPAVTYTLTYNANGGTGVPASQTGNGTITLSGTKPARDGYTFLGWATNATATSAQYQPGASFVLNANKTLYAVWKKIDTPINPANPTASATLNLKSSASVAYRSDVTITATASNLPSEYFLAIYDGNTLLAKGDNSSVSYHAGEMRSSKTFTVKVVDSNGEVQSNSSGALQKDININVSSGFFAKIIAFFKALFGMLPKVEIKP